MSDEPRVLRGARPKPAEQPRINEELLRRTTDAQVWAREFNKLFPHIEEGTMISWFANAIEQGRGFFARPTERALEREKNKRNCIKIEGAAIGAFVQCGFEQSTARKIVAHISAMDIPGVTIQY